MNSLYTRRQNNIFKQNINRNIPIYPSIVSPYLQQNFKNNYKELSTMANYNKYTFSKISNQVRGLGFRDNKIRYKSNSGTRKYQINNKNNFAKMDITYNINNSINNNNNYEHLKNIPSYNSLIELMNEFGIINSYRNLFNMILDKLDEEEKEDLCNREIKELNDLKSNIITLLKEIQSRKKTLKKMSILNEKLGEIVMSEEKDTDEEIIKSISDHITNLRIYTVNICYKMRKIKSKISQGYLYGKYDLDIISEKFGFDKNYLIKMKEEMNFLKEGYIKHFFNIKNDITPFLMKASENINNSNGDPYIHIVPISNELKENIKQCNYFIYQELIYLQNSKIKNSNDMISTYRVGTFNFRGTNNKINNYNNNMQRSKNDENFLNYKNIDNNNDNFNNKSKVKEFNNQNNNNIENDEKNKNLQDESILFEEKGINIKDILGETNNNNNQKLNKHNNSKMNSNIKIYSKNVSNKNIEKFSESQISKKSDLITYNSNKDFNKSSCRYANKYFKVVIFNEYINDFIENNYNEYYKQIPQQEVLMFNLQNNILPSLVNGITPFLLLVKEGDTIYGACAFNYVYNKEKLTLKINHISALADSNYNDFIDNIRIIYGTIFYYIKEQFYFDELFIEYSKTNKNEEIYDIFIKNLFFQEKTVNIKKNQNESNGGDEISNNEDNKINFLVYRNKMNTTESIKDCLPYFYGNNLFHFFNSIILTNTDKFSNTNNNQVCSRPFGSLSNINDDLKYSDSDIFINVVAINNLFQLKNNVNISKIYHRVSSLEKLIKIFIQNNINNEEIPLSIAENRYDIMCFVLNKIINDISRNSSTILNNYNIYNSKSFLDENTGISYNFMKSEKIYLLYDEKNEINFYIIVNNSLAICFIQFNNPEIKKYLFEKNIYIQINEIYKELIANKMIDLLENKFIWIPCFNVYRHLKCLINNSFFTVHEYIRINNKIIDNNTIRKKDVNKAYGLLFSSRLNSFLIEPQVNNDIILDNDFIIGIINNASFFNKLINDKNESSSTIKDKEKIIPSNYSIKTIDDKDKLKDSEYNKTSNSKIKESNKKLKITNDSEFPNIVLLNYINKNDFINKYKK